MASSSLSDTELGAAAAIELLGERNVVVMDALGVLHALENERKQIEGARSRLTGGGSRLSTSRTISSPPRAMPTAVSPILGVRDREDFLGHRGDSALAVSDFLGHRGDTALDVVAYLDQHLLAHSVADVVPWSAEVEQLRSEARSHVRSIESLKERCRRAEVENAAAKQNMSSRERVLEQAIEASEWICAKTKWRLDEWAREKQRMVAEGMLTRQEAADARTLADRTEQHRARDRTAWVLDKEAADKALAQLRADHRDATGQLETARARIEELEASNADLRKAAAPNGAREGGGMDVRALEERLVGEEVAALRKQVKCSVEHSRVQEEQHRLLSTQLDDQAARIGALLNENRTLDERASAHHAALIVADNARAAAGLHAARAQEVARQCGRVAGHRIARARDRYGVAGRAVNAWWVVKEAALLEVRQDLSRVKQIGIHLGKKQRFDNAAVFHDWRHSIHMRRFVRRRIVQFKHLTGRDAFVAWRNAARHVRTGTDKIRILRSRRAARHAAGAFDVWHHHQHRERRIRGVVFRALVSMCNRTLKVALMLWHRETWEARRQAAILRPFIARWRTPLLAQTFSKWRAELLERKRVVKTEAVILGRMLHRWVSTAWGTWLTLHRERRRVRRVLTKVVERLWHRGVSAAWGTWYANHVELRGMRQVERRVVERLLRRGLASAWETWCGEHAERRRFLAVERNVVVRMMQRELYCAWETWVGAHRGRKRELYIEGKVVGRMMRRGLGMALGAWRAAHGVCVHTREVLAAVAWRITHQGISRAFATWHSAHTQKRASLQIEGRAVARLLSRELSRAFHTWLEAHGVRARQRGVLEAAVRRMTHQGTSHAFETWHAAHTHKRAAILMERRVVARMFSRDVSRGFRAWQEQHVEARTHAHLFRIAASRVQASDRAEAFFLWRTVMVRERGLFMAAAAVVQRGMRRMLGDAWEVWAGEHRRHRICVRAIDYMGHCSTAKAWNTWLEHHREAKNQRRIAGKIAVKALGNLFCSALEAWKQYVRRSLNQDSTLAALSQRLSSLLQRRAMHEWRTWAARQAEQHAVQKNNPLKEPGWDLLMRTDKISLRASSHGWRDAVVRGKHLRAVQARVCARFGVKRRAEALGGWREKVEKTLAGRVWRLALKVFVVWGHQHTVTEKFLRLTSTKVIERSIRGTVDEAFDQWCFVTAKHTLAFDTLAARLRNVVLRPLFVEWRAFWEAAHQLRRDNAQQIHAAFDEWSLLAGAARKLRTAAAAAALLLARVLQSLAEAAGLQVAERQEAFDEVANKRRLHILGEALGALAESADHSKAAGVVVQETFGDSVSASTLNRAVSLWRKVISRQKEYEEARAALLRTRRLAGAFALLCRAGVDAREMFDEVAMAATETLARRAFSALLEGIRIASMELVADMVKKFRAHSMRIVLMRWRRAVARLKRWFTLVTDHKRRAILATKASVLRAWKAVATHKHRRNVALRGIAAHVSARYRRRVLSAWRFSSLARRASITGVLRLRWRVLARDRNASFRAWALIGSAAAGRKMAGARITRQRRTRTTHRALASWVTWRHTMTAWRALCSTESRRLKMAVLREWRGGARLRRLFVRHTERCSWVVLRQAVGTWRVAALARRCAVQRARVAWVVVRTQAARSRFQLLARGWEVLANNAFGARSRLLPSQVLAGPVKAGHALFRRFRLQLIHAPAYGADVCLRAFVTWRSAWARIASQGDALRAILAARARRKPNVRPVFAAWRREAEVATAMREEERSMGEASEGVREALEVFGKEMLVQWDAEVRSIGGHVRCADHLLAALRPHREHWRGLKHARRVAASAAASASRNPPRQTSPPRHGSVLDSGERYLGADRSVHSPARSPQWPHM